MINANQLRDYPLLAGLGEAELAGLAAGMIKRTYARGAYLFYPGNPSLNMYLVESGLVRLFYANAHGLEFMLNLTGPRGVVGVPLLDENEARLTGAAAQVTSVVLVLPRQSLFQLMDCSPQFARNLYLELTTSMRRLILHTRSLVTIDLPGRLASLLLNLSSAAPGQEAKHEIDLPVSQAELAGWVGASRGHLNRALGRLQQLGLIQMEGRRFIILDRAGLRRLTEEQTIDQV